jgi:hypothetical protein
MAAQFGQEKDITRRLLHLASLSGKQLKSADVLKQLRSLTLFDRGDVESGILVMLLENTLVPLFHRFMEKDSDDARKVIRLLHYYIRRALRASTMLQLHRGDQNPSSRQSRRSSQYDEEDIFETILNSLTNMDIFPGQRVPELNHKHVPRRLEALRTIATIFSVRQDPAIQTLITRQLMYVQEDSLRKQARRALSWKREVSDNWSMSHAVLGAAHKCLLYSKNDSELLQPDLSLPIATRALTSTNPATARYAARFLYVAAKSRPKDVGAVLLEHIMPRAATKGTDTRPPERLGHADAITSIRMLDTYSLLVQSLSDEEVTSKFYKAIVIVMCNARQGRIRLHAIRSLAKAASVSWSKLQDCTVWSNDEGNIFDISIDRNAGLDGQMAGNDESRVGFPRKLMYVLATMLSEALVRATAAIENKNGTQSHSSGKPEPNGEETVSFADSTLFSHAILRTIAAVGRQHIQYVFVATHNQNLDMTEVHVGNGTEALRASLEGSISKLTESAVASVRLQAMLALLWLAPAPDEYNRIRVDERTQALEHFRRALFNSVPLSKEMAVEFLRHFKERVRLSPSLANLLLRWGHYPFSENACSSEEMTELWRLCMELGSDSRQEVLKEVFSLLDGDHVAMADLPNRRSGVGRKRAEMEELQRAAIRFLGERGHDLCHRDHTVGGNWASGVGGVGMPNGGLESLFSKHNVLPKQNPSVDMAHVVKISNKCTRSLLLRIFRHSWFNSVHTRTVALEALASLACSPYASSMVTIVVFDFFRNVRSFVSNHPVQGRLWPIFVVRRGIKLMNDRLQYISSVVQSGKTWKPKKLELSYPEAEKLGENFRNKTFGIISPEPRPENRNVGSAQSIIDTSTNSLTWNTNPGDVTVADSDIWTFSPSALTPQRDHSDHVTGVLFTSPAPEETMGTEDVFGLSSGSPSSNKGLKKKSSNPFETFFA